MAQLSLAISVNDEPPRMAVKVFGIGSKNMRQVTVPRILKQMTKTCGASSSLKLRSDLQPVLYTGL